MMSRLCLSVDDCLPGWEVILESRIASERAVTVD